MEAKSLELQTKILNKAQEVIHIFQWTSELETQIEVYLPFAIGLDSKIQFNFLFVGNELLNLTLIVYHERSDSKLNCPLDLAVFLYRVCVDASGRVDSVSLE